MSKRVFSILLCAALFIGLTPRNVTAFGRYGLGRDLRAEYARRVDLEQHPAGRF